METVKSEIAGLVMMCGEKKDHEISWCWSWKSVVVYEVARKSSLKLNW